MIGSHPRLGFAVLGGVLAALITLVFLILRGGGQIGEGLPYAGMPSAADLPQQTVPDQAAARITTTRKPAHSVDEAWALRTASQAGVPVPAIRAYADAQLQLAKEQPGCHLAWNTLAGIGWVESQHGTIDGRTLLENGLSSTPVIGPALNGTGFAAIHSTAASARWHGDHTWEHAVGPLQFIASTWETWGADGDGDGVANPLDIDDAALTAARYLCADSHDLATADGWSAAVHSYNHDDSYVASVLNAANTYASRAR